MSGNNKVSRTESGVDGDTEPIQAAFDELVKVGHALDSLEQKCRKETGAIMEKYDELRTPILVKRNAFASKIPRFWSTAFENHPVLGTILEEEDLDAFKYLKEISIEKNENVRKFVFKFDENPYFTDEQLVKEITDKEDSFSVTNYPINWKPGRVMDICVYCKWCTHYFATLSLFA